MIKNIRAALYHMIKYAEWMDDVTKENALTKLDRMKHIVGYPKEIVNQTLLDGFFQGFTE